MHKPTYSELFKKGIERIKDENLNHKVDLITPKEFTMSMTSAIPNCFDKLAIAVKYDCIAPNLVIAVEDYEAYKNPNEECVTINAHVAGTTVQLKLRFVAEKDTCVVLALTNSPEAYSFKGQLEGLVLLPSQELTIADLYEAKLRDIGYPKESARAAKNAVSEWDYYLAVLNGALDLVYYRRDLTN